MPNTPQNFQALLSLLDSVRDQATDEYGHSDSAKQRDKGTFFEHLTLLFLQNDKTYSAQYKAVYTYKQWAKNHNKLATDTGIDLVAELFDGGTVAIQCKFLKPDSTIQRKQLDSFLTASGVEPFTHRLFVDSTLGGWGKNADAVIEDQQIPVSRLTITEMADGSVDWSQYNKDTDTVKTADTQKTLHDHQQTACDKVKQHFTTHNRGKLIMACGTGKTFTSLKIAEQQAGKGKRVLYLVPSLALMQQTIKEWFNDTDTPIYGLSVCSDATIGNTRNNDDIADISKTDLAIPATTKAHKIAKNANTAPRDKMLVIFATYQSLQVLHHAQQNHNMAEFDLIICDEAHRTTGATLANQDESNFVQVHNNDFVQAKKRLYMTATPRVYDDTARTRAGEINATLASMDDPAMFGNDIYTVSFNDAVKQGLLTDYKVIVLALSEDSVNSDFQKLMENEDFELKLEDTTKLIGCYKALCKLDLTETEITDKTPMKRAVAFCQTIPKSKNISKGFEKIATEYQDITNDKTLAPLSIEMHHVDGTYKADTRKQLLHWLQDTPDHADTCRILSNVRCLSEGVDVPTLDAVLFLHPRNSQVEVVQAVGRVMRKAENKKMGYIILPVAIPLGMSPEQSLNNNAKYKVVWQVLNALRSHDDRLNGLINSVEFDEDISHKIEVIATVNALPPAVPSGADPLDIGKGGTKSDNDNEIIIDINAKTKSPTQGELPINNAFNKAIMAKLVQKCGNRRHWEDWAVDIAKIAKQHIAHINKILQSDNTHAKQTFDTFLLGLQKNLNSEVSAESAVEMLAQHIITKPVFDALFSDQTFTKHNAVSIAMDKVLSVIHDTNIHDENNSLQKFYTSVTDRVSDTTSVTKRQKLIIELYDKFFKKAFPKTAEQLGIVYTPTEAVDFIIHSINDILKSEFNCQLGDKGVNIIDPFTGTGTFITRLLQSGLISPEQLHYKYAHEIHANEIILLAYYIASINIEQVYHEILRENGIQAEYEPFKKICLTDTFQMYEQKNMMAHTMHKNSESIQQQQKVNIDVIMGNPPYSAGQKNADDQAENVAYPKLDNKIKNTYAENTIGKSSRKIYDSYIRAIRWASDRLGDKGVLGFITNGGWLTSESANGLRKCLADEYTNIFVFNTRGNTRKDMLAKGNAGEGQNIFGSGSQTGITITLFVKNPHARKNGNIYYHDIGDKLSTKQKLNIIAGLKSITGITNQTKPYTKNGHIGWQEITPDKYHDWINQRDDSFYEHIPMGDKANKGKIDETTGQDSSESIFFIYCLGLTTNRDAWCYNSSKSALTTNMQNTIDFYNSEVDRYQNSNQKKQSKDFVNKDKTKIAWAGKDQNITKIGKSKFNNKLLIKANYRPFTTQWVYYDKEWNKCIYHLPKIFPIGTDLDNICICVTGTNSRNGFSAFITNQLPDLNVLEAGCQVFPLKLYETNKTDLLLKGAGDYTIRHGVTDYAQNHFTYDNNQPTKDDIFYGAVIDN